MPRLRLKICGIATIEEAAAAIAAGADAIGLDPAAFFEDGIVDDLALSAISLAIAPPVMPVVLTSALTAGTIAQQVDAAAAMAVQIARPLPPSEYPGLKRIIRGRKIIQSIPLGDGDAAAIARACAEFADVLHFAPADREEALLCRQIVEACGLPFFLRVGAPGSFEPMMRDVQPFAVDVVAPRTNGHFDESALAALLGELERGHPGAGLATSPVPS